MKCIAACTKEHASNTRAAHHLNARNAVVAEEQGDAAENVGSHCVGNANLTCTMTVWAVHEVCLVKTRSHALAGHFDHAEIRDFKRCGFGAVAAQVAVKTRLDLPTVLRHSHVDQVVDDDAAEVT